MHSIKPDRFSRFNFHRNHFATRSKAPQVTKQRFDFYRQQRAVAPGDFKPKATVRATRKPVHHAKPLATRGNVQFHKPHSYRKADGATTGSVTAKLR